MMKDFTPLVMRGHRTGGEVDTIRVAPLEDPEDGMRVWREKCLGPQREPGGGSVRGPGVRSDQGGRGQLDVEASRMTS